MLLESNYVYSLEINHPCCVVDKNHRHRRIKHNCLFSVNSTTSFGLTDQHQADQQYDRMWTVTWKCRLQLFTTCIVRLGVHIYIITEQL